MFAPAGYIAVARLWGDFERKYLKWCCTRACEFYQSSEYDQKDIFGSPRDLCEDLFLASLTDCELTICTPEHKALKFPAALHGTNAKLFQKATVFESYCIATSPEEAGEDGIWLSKMGSPQFEFTDHSDTKVAEWIGKYSRLLEGDKELQAVTIPFHTLPFLFERQSWVVARSFPQWAEDMIDDVFRQTLPECSKGGSICLDEGTARKWREAQSETTLRADLMKLITSVSAFSTGLPRKGGGRPRKIDEAKRPVSDA